MHNSSRPTREVPARPSGLIAWPVDNSPNAGWQVVRGSEVRNLPTLAHSRTTSVGRVPIASAAPCAFSITCMGKNTRLACSTRLSVALLACSIFLSVCMGKNARRTCSTPLLAALLVCSILLSVALYYNFHKRYGQPSSATSIFRWCSVSMTALFFISIAY